MYTRKSVGPRMEPWGTPPLTGFLANTSHPDPLKPVYYWEKKK